MRRVRGDDGHEAVGESLLVAIGLGGVLAAFRLADVVAAAFTSLTAQWGA